LERWRSRRSKAQLAPTSEPSTRADASYIVTRFKRRRDTIAWRWHSASLDAFWQGAGQDRGRADRTSAERRPTIPTKEVTTLIASAQSTRVGCAPSQVGGGFLRGWQLCTSPSGGRSSCFTGYPCHRWLRVTPATTRLGAVGPGTRSRASRSWHC